MSPLKKGLRKCEAAARSGQVDSVRELAHKMMPPCRHIGAMDLFDLLRKIEENIQNNAEAKDVEQLTEESLTNLNLLADLLKNTSRKSVKTLANTVIFTLLCRCFKKLKTRIHSDMSEKPFKIFVVEDSEWYNRLLVHTLSLNPDYEIKSFFNGKDFLNSLFESPDIVTLDYRLPDYTGLEILKRDQDRKMLTFRSY